MLSTLRTGQDGHVRALLPEPVPDVDVHSHYAAGWVETRGVRANMITSVDGAAAAGGLSAGLQVPGDTAVFTALRDLADIVLVGWSTASAESYGPVRLDDPRRVARARFGLTAPVPLAVVSRSLAIDPGAGVFAADAQARTLVITCASSDPGRRAELAAVADVLICGADDIDYPAVVRALAERGWHRVLCEGGPRILSAVLRSGVLDELCLTVSPKLVGPGSVRIVAGEEWRGEPRPLRLAGLLEDGGALFARYRR